MLVGKELEMYQVQGKKVQIYLNDGSGWNVYGIFFGIR